MWRSASPASIADMIQICQAPSLNNQGLSMNLSDDRLEEIRAWLCGESQTDPSVKPEEMAAMATELRQLRLRISTRSRAALVS
jgi:hypothetical protein